MAVSATFRIDALLAGAWTSLGADVLQARGIRASRGIQGGGPTVRTSGPDVMQFSLNNGADNAGGTLGWYSPSHASVRSGWTYGVPVRLVATFSGTDYVLWRGRTKTILPAPGTRLDRVVDVTAQGAMADAVEAQVREISPQVSQTEVQLLQAVVAALPSDARPVATSYDTALDTYPYAFDDIAGGVLARGLVEDVILNALGFLGVKGDGTWQYVNRHTQAAKTSSYSFGETDITRDRGLAVPSSLDGVFNRVRVTIHPRTIDAAATTVLFSTSARIAVAPGQTATFWGDYFVASNTLKLIGGTAQVTPIVATTDYTANTASDGSGADITANVTVTATAFAASAKFVATNNHPASTAWVAAQIRGKGIYDNAPQTLESYLAQSYGDRPLSIDLKYQGDAQVAQDFADYLRIQYQSLANQAETVSPHVYKSSALMTQGLTREVLDVIDVTETVTGLASKTLSIRGVSYEIGAGPALRVLWTVAPHLTTQAWILDDAVYSVLDSTTVLGYA